MNISEQDNFIGVIDTRLLRGELRVREPMRKHVSWRAGGVADYFYLPADLQDLVIFLRHLPRAERVHMIGLGSNLLVRDEGLRGVVVALHARLNDLLLIKQDEEGDLIYAEAGVPCAKLARFAALYHLSGAEFLAGIPGTVGGALAMNAGCYGAETWQIVEKVKTINRAGKLHERNPEDYLIGYRHIALQQEFDSVNDEEWFVGGWFRLQQGDHDNSRQKIKALLAARMSSQPLNFPNAGSVFRNPTGDYAARLIEVSGLKGYRVGGAMVSSKHANFIINDGGATATDIEAVINMIRDTVKKKTGIELIQEVRIIGDVGNDR
ncbi:UDP-N-acetylmuramate dehydrogenase [Nitrosomonas sp. Nm33]|uniref:UDP-N-acetylmuramate dehydrogenase n=1 Tax=Nitrosomonas sp. Nm33 TaxID=133724 RepID=UPI00089B752F|nr:UDP-N-acetylmuramate dehydrogenase [Nitrosomonas sp. Nm33]SDY20120.1 UDP-N-acetylmuramate dehydrogenase [Nitrosomonas sp. Nm33]